MAPHMSCSSPLLFFSFRGFIPSFSCFRLVHQNAEVLQLIAILLSVVVLSLRRVLLRLCPRFLGVKGYSMKLDNPNP